MALVACMALVAVTMHIPAVSAHADATTPAAVGVTLGLDFGNGTVISFSDLEGTDVLNLTQSAVEVTVSWTGDLAFVTSIAGVTNMPVEGRWWQYWVNGVFGTVAANKHRISDGDHVVWKLTASAFSTENTEAPEPLLLLLTALVAVSFALVLVVGRVNLRRGPHT
ncbi:MAG: DUF4430 domain-containing protein [Candidatus Thorarchaeota archaeon]|nr:DUF4430 domain-containing protein [Candidatus Thorarchaeota archaeon]